jgi:hypothetical protein
MYLTRHSVTITTDASGNGTGYTAVANGLIHAIRYVKADYDNGIDFVVTTEASGQAVLTGTDVNASATSYPQAATASVANAAALYAAGGTAVNALIPVADERIKIVVAQGGNVKTGTFHVYVG